MSTSEIRKIIDKIKDEKYRNAFRYQFLIGGTISEVCGKCQPLGSDAFTDNFEINTETFPAVFFKIKSARRGGKFRICALPLEEKYEPWSRPVFDWFQKHRDKNPFVFSKTNTPRANEAQFRKKRKELFKVDVARPKDYIRNARKRDLEDFYHFNYEDLALFGAWRVLIYTKEKENKIREILGENYQEYDKQKLINKLKTYFDKFIRYKRDEIKKNIADIEEKISLSFSRDKIISIEALNNLLDIKKDLQDHIFEEMKQKIFENVLKQSYITEPERGLIQEIVFNRLREKNPVLEIFNYFNVKYDLKSYILDSTNIKGIKHQINWFDLGINSLFSSCGFITLLVDPPGYIKGVDVVAFSPSTEYVFLIGCTIGVINNDVAKIYETTQKIKDILSNHNIVPLICTPHKKKEIVQLKEASDKGITIIPYDELKKLIEMCSNNRTHIEIVTYLTKQTRD